MTDCMCDCRCVLLLCPKLSRRFHAHDCQESSISGHCGTARTISIACSTQIQPKSADCEKVVVYVFIRIGKLHQWSLGWVGGDSIRRWVFL